MNSEILRFIQRLANPVLDVVFELCTMLGEQTILAVLFCAVYWCADKRLGCWLILSLSASLCLNGLLKDLVRAPRPFGEEGVRTLRAETATGYSFPSAHSQSAATFYWSLGRWSRKKAGIAAALLLIVLVGFSRLYLGVHYPVDVVCGIATGILVSELCYHCLVRLDRLKSALLACAALAAAAVALGFTEDTIVAAGMTAGAIAGTLFEQRFVRFGTDIPPRRKVCRFLAGAMLVGASFFVPKLLIPAGLPGNVAATALVAFVATGLYPWIFKKLRL